MAQYHPCYKANGIPSLARRITTVELAEALEMAHEHGLHRLDGRYSLYYSN
ncbi:MAG: hypothetical protein HYX81_01875 [Chloroflexi bacterium]|nr:hypothetical protein [Chloroflexota bacterium]